MHTPFERTLRALATERRRAGKSLAGLIADRKSTRLNSSHLGISYAVFCLKKKTIKKYKTRPHRPTNGNTLTTKTEDHTRLDNDTLRRGERRETAHRQRSRLRTARYSAYAT